VDVPVVFALGRYDHRADAHLAAAYLERLHAPAKRLIWFEGSAHNVPFEEPELFNRVVRDELQGIGMHADRR
jgi:pimeloyl-ACP methyl ester carboxylesterase